MFRDVIRDARIDVARPHDASLHAASRRRIDDGEMASARKLRSARE
jgi:hypothetical protein